MGKLELYIDYFKDKLFSKKPKVEKPQIDLEEERFESWTFSEKEPRFKGEVTNDYITDADEKQGSISITAKRKNIYAWTINPNYRYRDFVLNFTASFSPSGIEVKTEKAGTCALGFLFRYLNEGVFYALLVSDQGWVRLDVMVSGKPLPILGWTKPTGLNLTPEHNEVTVKLIAVDTSFHILVNEAWVASVENDVVQSAGKLCVAIQNWEYFSQNTCTAKNISFTSDIRTVEAADNEANEKADTSYDAHINLAKTFFAMSKYDSAAAEINKAETIAPLNLDDVLFAGRIYFSQGRKEDAEQAFKKALKADKKNVHIIEELASLYYYTNDFKKLGSILEKYESENLELFSASSLLLNFSGHYYNWNNEHEKASDYYERAFALKSDEGLFALNAALEYEILLQKEKAVETLLKAGYAFLNAQNYNDLAKCVNKLEVLAKDDPKTTSLVGKFYYGVENYRQALLSFEKICENGLTDEASDWYLYALLIKDSDYNRYLKILEKVTKLDKNEPLYFFRLAEARFHSGLDCSKQLEKALKLDENNAWVYNLKALTLMNENRLDEAIEAVAKARSILPDEIDLLTNYVEIKRLQGKLPEVMPLFDLESNEVDIAIERNRGKGFHIIANALYKEGNLEAASEWYEKAEKLLPDNYDLLLNHGQNSMELGMLNEADALLVKALDIKNNVEVYRLIARLSTLKGNYLRAKAVIEEAFSFYPDDPDLLYDLAQVEIQFRKKEEAMATYKKLALLEKSERMRELKQRIMNMQG